MKRSIISIVLLLIVVLASSGRDRLYIENFNIAAGETLIVPVLLDNDTAYSGLQTDLFLPDGLSLDMEDDEYIIDLTSRKNSTHSVASNLLSNGAIRIYISSLSAKEFSGNSGAIMTLSITAASSFSGQAVIELKNSVCAEAIGTRHALDNEICIVNPGVTPDIQGDVDGDGHVGMDDLTALINYLLTNDTSDINLENADCDPSGSVNMDDLTVLINYLLTNQWPEVPEEPEGTQTITVNGVSFKMVFVEGGTFMMGATPEQGDDAYNDEKPVHEVTLSSFYIGQTEVTQELWQAVMGSNPSYFQDDPKRPVEMVSWNDCQAFITQLNLLTGKQFRMPTEAEWEYAARGGNKSQGYKYSGSNDIDAVAWHVGNSESTSHVVATKAPNELGLYDMTGNVWEWVQDWYARYSAEPQINPTGPETGTQRVFRGGSWYSSARLGRVSYRDVENMTNSYNRLGLRLVLDNPEI